MVNEPKTRKLKDPKFQRKDIIKKKLISLRGVANPPVSDEELERAIDEAKMSIFWKNFRMR